MSDRAAIKTYLETQAQNVLIVTHRDPDLDALGSCLAMHFQLTRLGVEHTIWTADYLMDNQSGFMPDIDTIVHKLDKSQVYDTLLVLDSSNLERVKHLERQGLPLDDMTIINIDHHSDNNRFGNFNIYESISSVGELLCKLFDEYTWPMSPEIATCLYAAISFDTGRFLHSNTTYETLIRAGRLVEAGAAIEIINREMFENKSASTFDLMKVALDHLVVNKEKGYAYTLIPENAPKGEIKIVDFIRQLGDVDIFLVFRERSGGEVRVNLRSKSDFNVQQFAMHFDGGGHVKAAGISMEGPLEKVAETVLVELDKQLPTTSS